MHCVSYWSRSSLFIKFCSQSQTAMLSGARSSLSEWVIISTAVAPWDCSTGLVLLTSSIHRQDFNLRKYKLDTFVQFWHIISTWIKLYISKEIKLQMFFCVCRWYTTNFFVWRVCWHIRYTHQRICRCLIIKAGSDDKVDDESGEDSQRHNFCFWKFKKITAVEDICDI